MNENLRKIIQSDFKRAYGDTKAPCILPIQMRYLVVYRKAAFYSKKSIRGIFYRIRLHTLSIKTGIQIPTKARIGQGLFIGHFGTIIINPEVTIGDNVNIAPGVTIGKTNRGDLKGVPAIGNQVWIGTNAVVVGNIMIGNDVLIAPNAYVNTDIPDHSIVIGNPAQIHFKEKATEGYINRTVDVSGSL